MKMNDQTHPRYGLKKQQKLNTVIPNCTKKANMTFKFDQKNAN